MAGILSRAILLRDKPISFNVNPGQSTDVQKGIIEAEVVPSEISQDYVTGTDPITCFTLSSKLKQFFAQGQGARPQEGSDVEKEEGQSSPPVEKKLTVELWNTDTNLAALGIEVKAKFFADLLRLFGDDLTLKISLANLNVESSGTGIPGPDLVDIISTDEVTPTINSDGTVSFKDVILEFPGTWRTYWMAGQRGTSMRWRFGGVITLVLSSKVLGSVVTEEVTGIMGMNRKILGSPVGTDMKVVAKNGTEVTCHKAFLSVQSEQLNTMIQSGLDLNNNLMMPNVSEIGVKAFLEWVYFNGLEKAKDCDVAIELLQIAKHFEITDLRNAATDILLDAYVAAFPVSAAFRLFFYAKKNTNMNALKDKSLMILKCKRDELIKLEEYKDLFRLSPQDSVELCNALLYT